ncbi:MAG: hypothetical protein U0Z26_13745 [Anaerolineales bacterium]
MTDSNEEPKKPNVNADHNSNAVGSISAGGDTRGNIHIGNVYSNGTILQRRTKKSEHSVLL